MRHLRNLGSQFSISLPPDEEGFIGRECPVAECEGYFKLQPGTGLKGENLPCHCPYCGHGAGSDKFFTKPQIEYAKSIVMREVTNNEPIPHPRHPARHAAAEAAERGTQDERLICYASPPEIRN